MATLSPAFSGFFLSFLMLHLMAQHAWNHNFLMQVPNRHYAETGARMLPLVTKLHQLYLLTDSNSTQSKAKVSPSSPIQDSPQEILWIRPGIFYCIYKACALVTKQRPLPSVMG